MTLTFSNVQLQELLHRWRSGVQPWGDFVDTRKFAMPKSLTPAGQRVMKNIEHFRSNYIVVVICVIAFAVVTSPMLLVAVALSAAAAYAAFLRYAETRLTVMGNEMTHTHRVAAVTLLTVLLFWLLGTASIVFWIIGLSLVLVTGHAVSYGIDEELRLTEIHAAEVV